MSDIRDLVVDAPNLELEGVQLEIQNLQAKISLGVHIGNLVNIDLGVDLTGDTLNLELNSLQAEAYVRANLDRIQHIINRTLETIDNNPDVLQSLSNGEEPAKEERDSSEEPDSTGRSSSKSEPQENGADPQGNKEEVAKSLQEIVRKTEQMARELSKKANEG